MGIWPTTDKQSQSGFTLVELMITVGMIGILATLATPKLYIFIAKARESEAKIQLQSLHTSQEAFYLENGRYSFDSSELGYSNSSNVYTGLDIQSSEVFNDQVYCAWIWTRDGYHLCPRVYKDAWVVCSTSGAQFARCGAIEGGEGSWCFTEKPNSAFPDAASPMAGFYSACL